MSERSSARSPLRLLRRRVGRGSVGNAKFGDLRFVHARRVFGLFVLEQFCEAEIEYLRLARCR